VTRPYPYKVGTYEAAAGKQPGTQEFARLCAKRFGFKNLGTWVVRPMRGKDVLSVHATGAAYDAGYTATPKGRGQALDALAWLVNNAGTLGIVAVHDYMANPPRAWRCDRNGWKAFRDGELGPGGHWFHIELSPTMARDATRVRKAWLSLPKPPK